MALVGRGVPGVADAPLLTGGATFVGDVTLPPEGYQSRFSDSLNRTELEFLPLTNCEITSLDDGQTRHQDFLMLSKRHVRLAYPVGDPPPTGPPGA